MGNYRSNALRKEECGMATPVQELASMPSTATARTHSGANMELTSTPKHPILAASREAVSLGCSALNTA